MIEIKDYSYKFSKDNKPAAYANPGDTIKFFTLDCFDGQITSDTDELMKFDHDHVNPATGPLFVNDAHEGDVLVVDIIDIKVADHGVVSISGGALKDNTVPRSRIIKIIDNKAYFKNLSWDINTMIGVIGTPLKDKDISTSFVFEGGGNMDAANITKGVRLYFPVRVEGALLQIGDLHATMGDGEVAGTGIEIAGEVTIKVDVIHNFKLNWPISETDKEYFVNTCGKTCDEAILNGYKEMQRLISNAYELDNTDTALYMSMQGSLQASQAFLSPEGGGNSFRIGTPKIKGKELIK